jgi:hypothetical protein
MKNQNQWFFSPDLAFLASLSFLSSTPGKKKDAKTNQPSLKKRVNKSDIVIAF